MPGAGGGTSGAPGFGGSTGTEFPDITAELSRLAMTPGSHVLRPGVYSVTRTVHLTSGVRISGSGDLETTLVLAPGTNDNMFTNSDHDNGASDIELVNLRLEGRGRGQARPAGEKRLSFCNGVYLARVRGAKITDVHVSGFKQTAVHFRQCSDVAIENFIAVDLGWSGISTSGTDDLMARNFYIYDSGHDHRHSAIHLDGGTGAYLQGVVRKCVGNGVMLDAAFAPFANALVTVDASDCMRGIALIGSAEAQPTGVTIVNCEVSRNDVGIMVSNARMAHVYGVTVSESRQHGILFQGRVGGRQSIVAGCIFEGNAVDIAEIHASGNNRIITDVAG